MDLRASLWHQLPSEILDQVLSFLPVPDLSRYRTVCKRWNQLICHPAFGSVCAQNASKRDASFIAMRYRSYREGGEPPVSGWCFLDLNARRWYVVKDDPEIRENFFPLNVGMDGGLVGHWLRGRTIVYNPIAKTQRKLPVALPRHLTSQCFPKFNMVVDAISQSFKIFLVYRKIDTKLLDDPRRLLDERLEILNDSLLRVYDSVTNKWKGLSNVPSRIRSKLQTGRCADSVILQGFLYVFLPSLTIKDRLWRYNIGQDAWENLRVYIPGKLYNPKLIASTNRLCLAAWYGEQRLLKVSELKIPDKTHEVLFEIPRADIVGGFDLKTGIENPVSDFPRISVIGFNNSLMFMSMSTGISAVFDLVTRSWDHGLPPNPLEYLPDERCLFVGKEMNLLLPSVLW